MISIALAFILTIISAVPQRNGVEISFVNDSQETFVKMTVETDGKKFSFFNICPGERTNPVNVDRTYWFCHTVVVTESDTVLFTGFCVAGETLIKDGKLCVYYDTYPKTGEHRVLYATQVSYTGTAKNIGFPKSIWKDK